MTDKDAIKAARAGTESLEAWQSRHDSRLDLSGADLKGCDLRWMNFAGASLRDVNFERAMLTGAYFGPGRFRQEAPYVSTEDIPVDLQGASFKGAALLAATFNYPALRGARFDSAYLGLANFRNVLFDGNSFAGTRLLNTTFAACKMDGIRELHAAIHLGPSHLDIATLQQSTTLLRSFLRQTGIPDSVIEYLPDLLAAEQAIRFYSCFLSHSTKDRLFCDLLYRTLVAEGVRVWYAPEDIRGGDRLIPQITKAVNLHDKVIVVLSENSMGSPWVANEIKWARKREKVLNCQALFPIRLVPFEILRDWELIDTDTGVDLAAEVRSYFVPDFCEWRSGAQFDASVGRLLRDLRAGSAGIA